MTNTMLIPNILVLRNDETAKWENSSYILQKGEVGIGWNDFQGKKKPIIKIGDGISYWVDLPQNEYVFDTDLFFTSDFGCYKTEDGIVKIDSNGLTISELIKKAFTTGRLPEVIQPSYELCSTQVLTDTNTYEIGSVVNKIYWSVLFSPGWYEFGTTAGRYYKAPELKSYQSVDILETNERLFEQEVQLSDQEIYISDYSMLDDKFELSEIGNQRVCTLKTRCVYTNLPEGYPPIDSAGTEIWELKIQNDTIEIASEIFVEVYREGCFFGGIKGEITAEAIRNLNKLGHSYQSGTTVNFGVVPSTEKIVIAVPEGCEISSVLNITAGAEMLVGNNFTKEKIKIPGANGKYEAMYDVFIYTPAEPYSNATSFSVVLN